MFKNFHETLHQIQFLLMSYLMSCSSEILNFFSVEFQLPQWYHKDLHLITTLIHKIETGVDLYTCDVNNYLIG